MFTARRCEVRAHSGVAIIIPGGLAGPASLETRAAPAVPAVPAAPAHPLRVRTALEAPPAPAVPAARLLNDLVVREAHPAHEALAVHPAPAGLPAARALE